MLLGYVVGICTYGVTRTDMNSLLLLPKKMRYTRGKSLGVTSGFEITSSSNLPKHSCAVMRWSTEKLRQ